jgi:transposase
LLTSARRRRPLVSEGYDGPQVVGLDLHRNRTVMVRMTPHGEVLEAVRFANDSQVLIEQIGKAGQVPTVVLEATYGWYWAVDALQAAGASVHLAHPLGVKGFAYRRVKNDYRDAADLADLLRMGRLPEAWVAPGAVRDRRELVRHRHKIVGLRTSLKVQVHAVLAKLGIRVVDADLFGVRGRDRLASMVLPAPFSTRVQSQLRLIDAIDAEVNQFDRLIRQAFAVDAGYRVIQQLPGVGATFAAVFCAEIGDAHRFRGAPQVCSWAGLTPRHRESDHTVHRGSITKQGSRLVRWAAVEAVQRAPMNTPMRRTYERIVERRGGTGKNLAKVAAARKLLTLVYYGLRDGEIRCLTARSA